VATGELNTPLRFEPSEARRILEKAAGDSQLSQRLDRISAALVGRPYDEGLLGGGPESPEEFRVDLSAFDCVTYIETVLAMARAGTTNEFVDTIRRIRYEDGAVDWFRRNHYMIDWARNNEDAGFVENLTAGRLMEEKTCTLGLIPGLTEKTTTFGYLPTQALSDVKRTIGTGDLLLFVSTRQTLDVFHTGLVINREQGLLLRHATRTAGAVIEQTLVEFISQNTMAGFILLRPLCQT
jgi:hypothetical protein